MAQKSKVKNKEPQLEEQHTQQATSLSHAGQTTGIERMKPIYPTWPTSKPGPQVKQPPAGMKPVNAFRPEQVAELGYDQSTGEPGVSSPGRSMPDPTRTDVSPDQKMSASDPRHRGKQRL
ncbi:MAG TPA: hypothetical protein VL461_14115 [Dictyobacter sp.]|jgi:hypothetical protein|nr:hypothetical protein [Dictyobacter sp.]